MRRSKKIFFVAVTMFCFIDAKCQTISGNTSLQTADSFYFSGDWSKAANMYKQFLKDTSTNSVEWQRLGFSYYISANPMML